jgi:hypothetical protein
MSERTSKPSRIMDWEQIKATADGAFADFKDALPPA